MLPVLLGYLAGSVPFAFLLARRAGIDVRVAGSGNVGAANVLRTAGAWRGVVVMALDVAKGAAAVLVVHLAAGGVGARGPDRRGGHRRPHLSRLAALPWRQRRRRRGRRLQRPVARRDRRLRPRCSSSRSGSRATCRSDRSPRRWRCRRWPGGRARRARSSLAAAGTGALILFRHRANLRRLRRDRAEDGSARVSAHGRPRRRQLGHRARDPSRARRAAPSASGRATPRLVDEMAATRANPRYLAGVPLPAARHADVFARGRARRCAVRRSSPVPSHGLRAVVRRCGAAPAAGRGRGQRDEGARGRFAAAHVAGHRGRDRGAAPGRRALGPELRRPRSRAGCRPPCWPPRPTSAPPRGCRSSSAARAAAIRSDDVAGVEIGGALKNVIAIAAGRRRRAGPRAQRDGGAHHARAGGDVAARVRRRRPARHARGPERARRSRADLHRRI